MVDARLPDGSRVNAIIPPLALKGPTLTIRKFARDPLHDRRPDQLRHADAEGRPSSSAPACSGKLNILISGGTGTGKTTHAERDLERFIPDDERIVTIEDAAELQLQQEHVVALEAAPAEHRGQGRGHDPRPGAQRPAHAPRPHHRRRVPRRRGPGHAAGHEHRPRRLADHHPRQLAARRARAPGDHGADGRRGPAARAPSASRSRAPST